MLSLLRPQMPRRVAIDVAALALAAGAGALGASRAGVAGAPLGWVLVFSVAVLCSMAGRGAYRFRLQVSPLDQLGQSYTSTTISAALVLLARVVLDPRPEIASQTARMLVFAFMFLFLARVGLTLALRHPDRRGLPTLVVGAGTVGQLVARRLLERRELGLDPIGFLDKNPRAGAEDTDLPVLGASWDLARVVSEHRVAHVVIAFSTAPNSVLLGMVRELRRLKVQISFVPRLFEEVSSRVGVEHLGGVALLRVEQADPRGWQFAVKHGLDRALAGLGLVVAGIPMLVIALLVRLSSPGPVLFRQERVGRDSRTFALLKFRTMRPADPGEESNADWAARAVGQDTGVRQTADRRTPIGRFLRRSSLDELPQLLNIVRGEMSLVGPRPELPGYVKTFEDRVYRYGDRHRVKSGLTGWAQVHGLRGDTSLTDRVEWDNFYVENWSPWLDVKILAMTPVAVVSGRGAE